MEILIFGLFRAVYGSRESDQRCSQYQNISRQFGQGSPRSRFTEYIQCGTYGNVRTVLLFTFAHIESTVELQLFSAGPQD
jgi:hypothetical protein